MAHQMARGASRSLLIKALAGAMVLAAVSAPLASASGLFGVDAAASFAGAESAAIEGADASVGGRRGLQQVNCADICKSSPKNPVCGVDGKTYDNACIPICGQKKIKYWGKCSSKPCLCPPVFAPVCAGGKTYLSSCFAKCAGAGGAKDGYCGAQCKCPSTSSPVCGIDGKTYDNWCKSVCGGTFPYYSGSCDARIGTCKCPSVNDPVCVSSVIETTIAGVGTTKTPIKTTYSSPCLAKCQGGATTWAKGVCADYPLYDSSSYTCGCSLELKPVCAIIPVINRTVTLNSKCAADCSGYKVQYDGVCKDECLCPANAKPVCVDGKKPYLSACQARCKGAKTWTEGACKQCASCPTPMSINDYACGADGLQYMSKCAAECAGTEVAYQGLCKGLGGKK